MGWAQFLSNIVVTGILLYVIQTFFDERASKRLEDFKVSLRSAAFERETRFAKLHDRRVKVVAELYKRLVRSQHSLRSFAHAIESDRMRGTKRERDKAAEQSVDAFWDYFEEHRIYLPEDLGERIDEFYRRSVSAYLSLGLADIAQELGSSDESDQREYTQNLAEASRILADDISPVRDDIEQEFRRLLGSR
jgi:hypothetical protein